MLKPLRVRPEIATLLDSIYANPCVWEPAYVATADAVLVNKGNGPAVCFELFNPAQLCFLRVSNEWRFNDTEWFKTSLKEKLCLYRASRFVREYLRQQERIRSHNRLIDAIDRVATSSRT
jgi:hypothetical protein